MKSCRLSLHTLYYRQHIAIVFSLICNTVNRCTTNNLFLLNNVIKESKNNIRYRTHIHTYSYVLCCCCYCHCFAVTVAHSQAFTQEKRISFNFIILTILALCDIVFHLLLLLHSSRASGILFFSSLSLTDILFLFLILLYW